MGGCRFTAKGTNANGSRSYLVLGLNTSALASLHTPAYDRLVSGEVNDADSDRLGRRTHRGVSTCGR